MTLISLTPAIDDYLQTRRALGYQLRSEEILLRSLARFVQVSRHRGPLTAKILEDWARASRRSDPYTWSRRLAVARPFARYLRGSEAATEIPAPRVFGPAHRRLPPQVLSPDDVMRFVQEAEHLSPQNGLRPWTFTTLFGLLACTGLRVSEALRLETADVDLDRGVLQVRESKFLKSRLVPLHTSTVQALRRYAQQRDKLVKHGSATAFFLLGSGVPVTYSRTRTAVQSVSRRLGTRFGLPADRPTLRCLRHTFACRRLTAWYRQGLEVNDCIHSLSTYMGHGKVTDTFWYLSSIPELLALAGKRSHHLGNRQGGQS